MKREKENGFEGRLILREVVPYLNLPSHKNNNVNLWDFKQRKNIVIIFHHGMACASCRNKLKKLAKVYNIMQSLETEVFGVSFNNTSETKKQTELDGISFLLLSDLDGETTERFTYVDKARNAPFPSVFITDRFGELRYQKIAREAEDLPGEEEILSWLLLIQTECPECSHL
ncbi:redoxin domain-containing protein [Candidatus Bathyarchaeota archaeon]|nr:redoxin domain-containing protein [Candidatus Bathyarchaeota archaeon]